LASSTVIKKESFVILTPGVNIINFFCFIAEEEAKQATMQAFQALSNNCE
jgi:hypothetical protein